MKRLINCIILGVIGLLPLMAQTSDARAVLDRMAESFYRAGGVEISFTVHAPEGNSKGTIRLKGEKFELRTGGITTWFDGKTQWSYLEANNEVNITEPTADELNSIHPYAWLSLYKHGYCLTLEPGTDANTYKVVMTAVGDAEVKGMTLIVTKSEYRPVNIEMLYRGYQEPTEIVISNYRTGQKYVDSSFVFDAKKHPGVEVIDLR